MKTLKALAITVSVITISSCSIEASEEKQKPNSSITQNLVSTTFKVWGNCEMCEETIEKSLEIKGVTVADWNTETKDMSVRYDTTLTNLDKIQKSIAAVGYDTEKYRADINAYANLQECCQYDRKP